MEFKDWITQKYLDWRGNTVGNEGSITKFSQTMGLSHQVVTAWMNGSIPDRQLTIDKLLAAYPEAGNYLNIKPPIEDPLLNRYKKLIRSDPELMDLLEQIGEMVKDDPEVKQNLIKYLTTKALNK